MIVANIFNTSGYLKISSVYTDDNNDNYALHSISENNSIKKEKFMRKKFLKLEIGLIRFEFL